ncbi:MAG: N-acetylmuramoyl-L-alanine amidase [Clostridium sp.]
MKKINTLAIDIGHNNVVDRGAVGIKYEDELNYQVGNRLLERLGGTNIKVIRCTPEKPTSLKNSLSQRCAKANQGGADLFISIHHNACPGGYGCEGLCIPGGIAEEALKEILKEISKLGLRNRGIKDRRDLYVIRNTSMPALVVECAFVDSEKDMEGYNPVAIGDAIFDGLAAVLGLSSQGSEEYYTVAKGDTLWGISRRFNTSVEALVSLNGIGDRNLISIGQRIRIR